MQKHTHTLAQRAKSAFAYGVALAVLAGGALLQGCGGADGAVTAPRHGEDFVVFWQDAAEAADYERAATFKYEFRCEPFDVVLATNDPRASYARLLLIDYIGTEAFVLTVIR